MRIARWISNVEPSAEEETEEPAYYDGDGTPETDVISVRMAWSFEGMYDDEDPAHQFIRSLEFETGEGRKVMYKQVRQDGTVLEGPATVTEDRKSTRLNSSHVRISYAVFCLKKK